ncbi:MAG: hypothetical protein CM1200mP39_27710 [Dehalococcoidia bacterium]|nr:MAG: hypothetical protein CM1200mP39_27710 [Dehalococcoidia bacterium]
MTPDNPLSSKPKPSHDPRVSIASTANAEHVGSKRHCPGMYGEMAFYKFELMKVTTHSLENTSSSKKHVFPKR